MQLTIKKIRMKELTLEVEMEEVIERDGRPSITNDIKKKSDLLIHQDMQATFDALIPHMVLICDQKESTDADLIISDIRAGHFIESIQKDLGPRMDPYKVTGISIAGDGEHEGVVLIGQKRLKNNMVLNLIAPFTKFFDGYKYGDTLSGLVSDCINEAELYLFEGKCAEPDNNQLDLFEDQEPFSFDDTTITASVNGGEPVDITDAMKRESAKNNRKPKAQPADTGGY